MNPKDRRNPVRKILTRVVEMLNHLPGADRIAVRSQLVESPRIPAGFDGCTIVQISDLHGRWFGSGQERLLAAVRRQKPDLILVTGDWVDVDYQEDDERCCQVLLEGLVKLAPVYGIIGNHEARALHRNYMTEEVEKMGVRLLIDENVQLRRRGDRISLIGLDTPYDTPLKKEPWEQKRQEDKYRQALLGLGAGEAGEGLYRIAMAHRPELLDLYERLGFDLVLSGHAHGGLMKLPFGKRLLAPGQGWLPRYTHGLYAKEDTRMIVSCGLGGPRIGIVPEIGRIVLKQKRDTVKE